LKRILFAVFQKACKLVDGTGISRIPGILPLYNFLFRRLWTHKSVIEIQGSKMYVNSEGLPRRYELAFQGYITLNWEKVTTEMFKEAVREGDVVVDIGANIGYFTLLAARLVGKTGKVYAFEPEPTNYNLLLKNIELNGYDNIVPVQKAVSNKSGVVRLFVSEEDAGNSTIFQYGEGRNFIEVEAVTLDEFFADKKRPINVIKMDAEGAEMAVLLGMDRIITENPDIRIFSELYPELMTTMGYSPEKFIQRLMEKYHFSVLPIDRLPEGVKNPAQINNAAELKRLFEKVDAINLFIKRT
jgi:FkbM family methyltransferase